MPQKIDNVLSIYASCGEFAVRARGWQWMLALAQWYGWQPQGTAPPDEVAVDADLWKGDPSDWDGRYFPAYGQQVTEVDAKGLAAALERALPDIPHHAALGDTGDGKGSDSGWLANVPDVGVNPLEKGVANLTHGCNLRHKPIGLTYHRHTLRIAGTIASKGSRAESNRPLDHREPGTVPRCMASA